MSMTVVDDSLRSDDAGVTGLSVVIFRPDPALFPAVHSEDEIVQCRHMRVQVFQGSLQALSTNWSAFTVFARNEQGRWVARPVREIGPGERSHLDRISARTGHTAALVRSSPTKPGTGRRQLTIDLVTPSTYFDLVAQVVHVLPAKQAQMTSVLLTDYTANLAIQVNPTDFELSPDYEHRLLLVAFWDNFAARAAALCPGQIIRVVNLRSKVVSEDGPGSGPGGLIAVLHGDRSSAEKIFLLANSTAEAVAILERRRELFGGWSEAATGSAVQRSPPRAPAVGGGSPAGKGLTASASAARSGVRRPLFDTQPEQEEVGGLAAAIGSGGRSASPTKFHPLTSKCPQQSVPHHDTLM